MNAPAEKDESPRRARRRINLQRLVEEAGGAAQLHRESGTPKSHISVLLAGKRGLGDELAAKLETLYNKPAGWFDTSPEDESNVEEGPATRGMVPLISWVQAGGWCGAAEPFPAKEAEKWMPCPVPHGDRTYSLRVRGDSMTAQSGATRTYPEGCVIYVDPDKSSPINGDRVIARLIGTDEVTFKVYKEEDGRRWLQPLNPNHLPIRDEFTVCGTIIGKWEDG